MEKSEFQIIKKYFIAPDLNTGEKSIELGVGDDAALVSIPADHNLSISTDVLVEGIHFPKNADAGLIAKKALGTNLSDLAAMASKPLCFTLGLVLPDFSEDWLHKFSKSLGEMAKHFGIALVGGDLTEGPMTIAIQVHGINPIGMALRRSAAQVGDHIYVTGKLGDAAIGLLCIGESSHIGCSFKLIDDPPPQSCRDFFVKAYYEPEPRVDFALQCRDYINSAIDISDGLQGDLAHILSASNVGALIDIEKIPFSKPASCCLTSENLYRAALYGGEDYELCVTVTPENCSKFELEALKSNTEITRIGEVIPGSGIQFFPSRYNSSHSTDQSYSHFRGNDTQ